MTDRTVPWRLGLLGCGDIALRLMAELQGQACGYAFSRSPKTVPQGFQWRQADAGQVSSYSDYLAELDVLLITLTPAARGDEGYRLGYVEPIRQLVSFAQGLARCPLLLFVSSTAVYGENSGAVLDDDSATRPSRYNGERLLEAEQLLARSGLPYCCVRFSGIYGPKRKRLFSLLLDEVRSGRGYADTDAHWGNRIHIEDCIAVLQHVLMQPSKERDKVYVASDPSPSLRGEIKHFLAGELSQPGLAPFECGNARGKRLMPKRLLASSFHFKYPSFREGYQAQLQAAMAAENPDG